MKPAPMPTKNETTDPGGPSFLYRLSAAAGTLIVSGAILVMVLNLAGCETYLPADDPASLPRWKQASGGRSFDAERIEVPGGWLYRIQGKDALVFVPAPKE